MLTPTQRANGPMNVCAMLRKSLIKIVAHVPEQAKRSDTKPPLQQPNNEPFNPPQPRQQRLTRRLVRPRRFRLVPQWQQQQQRVKPLNKKPTNSLFVCSL